MGVKSDALDELHELFAAEDLEWKPQTVMNTWNPPKAMAVPYVDNRAIMRRLDEVCGAQNWQNRFESGPDGGVLCGIGILVERADGAKEWVWKWDVAENTKVEPVKGGASGAMKRAAVHWGIGRYLYTTPVQFIECELKKNGRFKKWKKDPRLPAEFYPDGGGRAQAREAPAFVEPEDPGFRKPPPEKPAKLKEIEQDLFEMKLPDKAVEDFKRNFAEALSQRADMSFEWDELQGKMLASIHRKWFSVEDVEDRKTKVLKTAGGGSSIDVTDSICNKVARFGVDADYYLQIRAEAHGYDKWSVVPSATMWNELKFIEQMNDSELQAFAKQQEGM